MTPQPNEAQELIAGTLEGRVLVSAGAGTGKTRTLTERFLRAVTGEQGRPARAAVDQVLTITFTEKAAGEIAERIRVSLRAAGRLDDSRRLDTAWISTIHGLCARILRRHAIEAGIDPAFTIADEVTAGYLSDEAMEAALRTGSAEGANGIDLVEEYDVAAVAGAVRSLAGTLRSRGLGADAIRAEACREPARLYAEALRALDLASQGFAPHADQTKTAAANLGACRSAIDELRALDPDATEPTALAQAVWRAMAVWGARAATGAAVRDTARELKEARVGIAREAAACLAAPRLAVLIGTLDAYLAHYARLKAERGVLDFDDLQSHAIVLLERDERLRERYREHFRLVMVDEFQDTDEVQLRLVESLAGDGLCTVGDERQSIYAFRGADVEVYRRHRSEMECAGAVSADLVLNYRSHPDILGFVNRLFESEGLFGRGLPGLVAGRQEPAEQLLAPGAPRVTLDLVAVDGERKAVTEVAEARALAERFAGYEAAGFSPGDMVVLVRAYQKATVVGEALRQQGFDVVVVGGSRFFGLPEISMLRALCRVLANPHDDEAMLRLLLSEMSGVSDEGVYLLRRASSAQEGRASAWNALLDAERVLAGEDRAAAVRLREAVASAARTAGAGSLATAVESAVTRSGAGARFEESGTDGAQAAANVRKFIRKIEAFERSGQAGAAAFVARLDAEVRFGRQESPAPPDGGASSAVRIMSIHASKGLEFPVVAVPFLGDGLRAESGMLRTAVADGSVEVALGLPSTLIEGAPKEFVHSGTFLRIHEEAKRREEAEVKRQLYVACTRAREALVLTGSQKCGADVDEAPPSPLVWIQRALRAAVATPDDGGPVVRTIPGGVPIEVFARTPAGPDPDSGKEPLAPGAAGVPPVSQGQGAGEAGDVPAAPEPAPSSAAAEARCACGPRISDGVPPRRPERVSVSDLALFDRCALRYWAQRVARFGDVPAAAADPTLLGSALHALLQADRPGSHPPDGARVEAVARHFGLAEGAADRLSAALGVWHASATRADLHRHERVWTEYPFDVRIDVGGAHVDFTGAIDAWGRTGDGGLVVDYKTGTSGSAEELRERYRSQARGYAYVALAHGCAEAEVRFVRPEVLGENGEMQEVRYRFTAADRAEVERDLRAAVGRIEREPYRALERWDDMTCGSCRIAGTLCPLTPPRRHAAG